jgi:uncharacterized SAM-binding protein YcdF (DUF218 family)
VVRARAFPLKFLAISAIIVLLGTATHRLWLAALGNALVSADGPAHADLAVVLGGDYWGHRILKAAELIQDGYVPQALVSGPAALYGDAECDLAVAFAVKSGYPERWFIRFPHRANSTEEEAGFILPELRRRGVHRYLLVTSDYHTARARRIYRALAPDLEARVVASPDEYYRPDSWWRSRPARKVFLFEWTKTITGRIGM